MLPIRDKSVKNRRVYIPRQLAWVPLEQGICKAPKNMELGYYFRDMDA